MTRKSQSDQPNPVADIIAGLDLPAPDLSSEGFAAPLLAWYGTQARDLPWRKKWPELAPAYDVFLSELMLQQTVVATVIPYFLKFKKIWPDIQALAACDEADLLREWAGLGYYARARNMRKAAIAIVTDHNADFPQSEAVLIKLPGIGPYTAAAIAAFAFDQPAIVLDGNVERVLARFAGIPTALPALKSSLRTIYPEIAPTAQHADFAQAIMDLGARICIAAAPRCQQCPLQDKCVMANRPEARLLPVKLKKPPKPKRQGVIFVATKHEAAVMERRPQTGLLGAMMGFPTAGWDSRSAPAPSLSQAPFDADWQEVGTVRHVFTHFALELVIYHTTLEDQRLPGGLHLVNPDEVGLASVFAKVWQQVCQQR